MAVWKVLDTKDIPVRCRDLPAVERKVIYQKVTKSYKTTLDIPKGSLSETRSMGIMDQVFVALFYACILAIPLSFVPALTLSGLFLPRNYTIGLAAFYAILMLVPVAKDRRKEWIEGRLLQMMYHYSSYKVVWTSSVESHAKTPAIGSGGPHGVFPLGAVMSIPAMNEFMNINFVGGMASVVFSTPGLRSIGSIGGIDVGKKSVQRAIVKEGKTVGIVSDGISGCFAAANGTDEYLAIEDKKGISKMALRLGLNIAVVHWFGNSVCLEPKVDGFGMLKALSRALKMSIFFFTGRFYLPIPTRDPIVMCIGESIVLSGKKVENPSKEQVDEVHKLVVEAHKKLFDDMKGAYGGKYASKELVICS
ncbi:hypothetical protein TrVE_jg4918 [Triparma verrucosa]|uniref:Acyltransferase n=1 Tax=Triparma verrucosa TaxID=1606542 RepID=A0A9W7BVK4_9STRA|nr:hypothetical protein TrVE_jg4918 [Triparma verrucosa]